MRLPTQVIGEAETVRDLLTALGNAQAQPHHVLPASGWVSYHLHGADDIAPVVALFRLNYDRPWLVESSPDLGAVER